MAQLKSHQADRFCQSPDASFALYLIYGPDTGLVSERANAIAAGLDVDLTDPFSHVRLDADTVAAERGRLADEANAISMFGGNRLLRISGSTRRNLADCIAPVVETQPENCWIIVEAGDLKRDAALRKLVEGSDAAMAIPCYPDNDRDLDRLIGEELGGHGLRIDDDARLLLRAQLGGDRMASRNELAKLALYCDGREQVTVADIRAVTGDSSLLDMSDVVDAAMTGDVAALERHLRRLFAQDAAPDMIVLSALRQFQTLQQLRSQMDRSGQPADQLVGGVRPQIHFSRKAAFSTALSRWQATALVQALRRLDAASFDCRANPALARSLASTALMAIAMQAGARPASRASANR
jgi:DNA polymerase III subunit delta